MTYKVFVSLCTFVGLLGFVCLFELMASNRTRNTAVNLSQPQRSVKLLQTQHLPCSSESAYDFFSCILSLKPRSDCPCFHAMGVKGNFPVEFRVLMFIFCGSSSASQAQYAAQYAQGEFAMRRDQFQYSKWWQVEAGKQYRNVSDAFGQSLVP